MGIDNHCGEAPARRSPITNCWPHSRQKVIGFETRLTEVQINPLFLLTVDARPRVMELCPALDQLLSENTALAAITCKKQIKLVVLQNYKGLDVFS